MGNMSELDLSLRELIFEGTLEENLKANVGAKIKIITPKNPFRGSQISFYITDKNITFKDIYNWLVDNLIVCDIRENIFRIAVCPLYNTFVEIEKFVQILKEGIYKTYTN